MNQTKNDDLVREGKQILLEYSFLTFATTFFKIISKDGQIIDFKPNEVQKGIIKSLETQLKTKGKTRTAILKARQQGSSTVCILYFLWRAITQENCQYAILTHTENSSKALLEKVKFTYNNLNPVIKHLLNVDNLTSDNVFEMSFSNGSSILCGTAGGKEFGRGRTFQGLLLSESAYYPVSNIIGIVQAIGNVNTDIIHDSTAYQVDSAMYHIFMSSEDFGYEKLFFPWHFEKNYKLMNDKIPSTEAFEYRQKHNPQLTDDQLRFFDFKVHELGNLSAFHREYPITPELSFAYSEGENNFIKYEFVYNAIERGVNKTLALTDAFYERYPLIMGVDPATDKGEDKTAICVREGKRIVYLDQFSKLNHIQVIAKMIEIYNQFYKKIDAICIDASGGSIGHAIYTDLKINTNDVIIENKLVKVEFGGSPENKERYSNKSCEIWDRMRMYFELSTVEIVNVSQHIRNELVYQTVNRLIKSETDKNKLTLQQKFELSKSPDLADAVALTFAMPYYKFCDDLLWEIEYKNKCKEKIARRETEYYQNLDITRVHQNQQVNRLTRVGRFDW